VAANKGLKLELHTDGGLMVASDRRRVRQILANLVSNAIKFTPAGGVEILLTVDRATGRAALSGMTGENRDQELFQCPVAGGDDKEKPAPVGEEATVTVRDTGVGMAPADVERLFEAFSRIYIKDRPVVEGTGLGLYLSQRLAALLGGVITVKSEPGRGSEFTLRLPLSFPGEIAKYS